MSKQKQQIYTKTCPHCKEIFKDIKSRVYANHVRWCPSNNTNGDKGVSNYSNSLKKLYESRNGKITEFKVLCHKCNNEFSVYEKEKKFPMKQKYFCSIQCANSRNHNDETRMKISNAVKEKWKDKSYAEKCINNNTLKQKRFTSKSEEEIRNYFISTYSKYNWTFGGVILYQNEKLVRDLYCEELKVCIEYDGIWHFKDIHGQLEQKQYKDNLLEQWCIEHKWKLIRISDSYYHNDIDKSIKELEYYAFNDDIQLIKLYDDFYK